jgi:dihydropteroate synthase
MGILNLTEDSFYDGGKNNSLKKALAHTEKMLLEGAFFIDIGVASSKPGSPLI